MPFGIAIANEVPETGSYRGCAAQYCLGVIRLGAMIRRFQRRRRRPKNHYRSRSRRGFEIATMFLESLIESAKLCGVEPNVYLLISPPRAALADRAVTLQQPSASDRV